MNKSIKIIILAIFLISPLFAFAQEKYPDGTLIRAENDYKIYVIQNGNKRWIRNVDIFNSYNFNWNDIKIISQKELEKLPINNLIREKNDVKVYALNDNGYKRHILNPEIFDSYNLNWRDVAVITETELSIYLDSYLIREVDNPKVYFLDGKTKRWVINAEVFYKNDFDWNIIQIVNKKDAETYEAGSDVTPGVKVEKPKPSIIPPVSTIPTTAPNATSTVSAIPATPATPAQPSPGTGTPATPATPATSAIPATPSTPTSAPTPEPIKPSLTLIEIKFVKVTPSINSVNFEWETNIPTNAKVFVSGLNMTTIVSQSVSGLSTHHIASISSLRANTSYEFKIEAVSTDILVKTYAGTFKITSEANINITFNPNTISATGWTVKTFRVIIKGDDGETKRIGVDVRVNIEATDSSQNIVLNGTGNYLSNGDTFYYYPKTAGIHTITFSVPSYGLTKSISFDATLYTPMVPVVQLDYGSPTNVIMNKDSDKIIATIRIAPYDDGDLLRLDKITYHLVSDDFFPAQVNYDNSSTGVGVNICFSGSCLYPQNSHLSDGVWYVNRDDFSGSGMRLTGTFSLRAFTPKTSGKFKISIDSLEYTGERSGNIYIPQGLPFVTPEVIVQ